MKSSTKAILALAAMVAVGVIVRNCVQQEERREAVRVANRAAVLPAGVREQWFAAMSRAFAEKVQVRGGRIQLTTSIGVKWVPLSQTSVSCDSFGIAITELGDEGAELALVGGLPGERGIPKPDLVVGNTSPAARQLYSDLCAQLSGWLATR